jgi:hypothetical protein
MYIRAMEDEVNPFLLQGYAGPDTFCDRQQELAFLAEAMANQRNVSLISLRRLGKTALIRHFFATQKRFTPAFVDLYRTVDQQDMVLRIVREVLRQVGKPTGAWLREAGQALRSLELSLQFDALTGLPEFGVMARPGKSQAMALDELFRLLEKRQKPVVIALDEFQQVAGYPERNTEALLREQVQQLRNVQFIFSGSDRRMMQAIFAQGKRPFYQATEPLYLGPIPEAAYTAFILRHFRQGRRQRMDAELVRQGLSWCNGHTYYVQYLFNRLYALGLPRYGAMDLLTVQAGILKERAPEYMTVERLLSPYQAALLRAVAKEGAVPRPGAGGFIRKYGLSAVSTVRQSLGVLLEKELLHQAADGYRVTDVFLGHWLAEY